MPPPKLANDILLAAIEGFKAQRTRIDAQIEELRQSLDVRRAGSAGSAEPAAKRRKVSAAARRRMAQAQKARWARIRGESGTARSAARPAKRKRRISEAGLQRIIAATKRRWAAVRAAKAAASA